jgi:hypothetical protein
MSDKKHFAMKIKISMKLKKLAPQNTPRVPPEKKQELFHKLCHAY